MVEGITIDMHSDLIWLLKLPKKNSFRTFWESKFALFTNIQAAVLNMLHDTFGTRYGIKVDIFWINKYLLRLTPTHILVSYSVVVGMTLMELLNSMVT